MNNRQAQAERHKAELLQSKNELINKVNQQIQNARSQGYQTEVAPQLLRLLGVKSYRKRDVQAMNKLLDDEQKLLDYMYVYKEVNGIVIDQPVVGEAFERYRRYESSPIYHAQSADMPSEKDIIFNNFSQMAEQSFTDDSVYKQFISMLDDAYYNADTSIADESMWKLLHAGIDKTKKGKTKSQGSILSSKRFWLAQNNERIADIHNAVVRLAELEGENEVARRLSESGETIIDEMIVAAIGYNESSAKAVQSILNVLLPSGVRNRAMSMGESLIDEADDFGDYE